MSFTQWDGMPLVCLQSNTLWIQGMTQRNSQQKTLLTSNAKSMRLASLTTGTVKSIRQIRTTTSGHNGSSLSFTKKAWPMKRKCQSTGWKNWEQLSPTKKFFQMEHLSVVAIRLSANQCANGCLKSLPMRNVCWRTWMTLTGQSLSRTCNATGLGNQLVPMSPSK